MEVQFEMFHSSHERWQTMFAKAAIFSTKVGPDRLIGISHSQEGSVGVVTVWYWSDEKPAPPAPIA
jgi:hypothetical protein